MRSWMRRWRQRDAGGDRGSLALFVIVFAVAVLALAALLVDVGSAMNVKQRAADAAEQAARAAADDVSLTGLRQSGVAEIDTTSACAQAGQLVGQYARANDVSLALDTSQGYDGTGCQYWSSGAGGWVPYDPGAAGAADPAGAGAGPAKVTVYVTVTSPPPAFFPQHFSVTMKINESACALTAEESC